MATKSVDSKREGGKARDGGVYNDKSSLETVLFVVHTSDEKNLPPDVQTKQQYIKEQKPEIITCQRYQLVIILCIAITTYHHPRQWLL